MTEEPDLRRALVAMLVALLGCVVVMMALGIGKATGTVDPLIARRGVGAMLGLTLVVAGNFVPKLRLFQPAAGTANSDAIDRFAGWTFVACGLAFAGVFLLAPADRIMLGAPLIVVAGFLVVLARWLMWKERQPSRLSPRFTPGRFAMATVFATVLWGCAIFITDALWGDAVSRPLGMLFPFVLIVFPVLLGVKRLRSPDA